MSDSEGIQNMEKKRKIIACASILSDQFLLTIRSLLLKMPEYETTSDSDSDGHENEETMKMMSAIASLRETPIRIEKYIEKVVSNYNEVEFQQNFRLTREAFKFLLSLVAENIAKYDTGRPQRTVENQLLATIWLLATPECFRSVSERFNMGKSSLSNTFFRIINALNKISPKIIKWPSTEEIPVIRRAFDSICKLQNIIGAIDGTYVAVKAPKEQAHCYTNRKKFHSITLQAICDHNMRFLDCSVGYPSSVHDARVFRNSDIYEYAEESTVRYFPDNSVILGDKAYPVMTWCIPPFIDNGRLSERQKKFNKAHAVGRQVVERSFALLFGRWRRLRYLDMNKCEAMPLVVMACCVLHNICIRFPEETIDHILEEGYVQVELSSPVYRTANRQANRNGINLRNSMALNL